MQVMAEGYDGDLGSLTGAIYTLTPLVQSRILEQGYQITRQIAEEIVKQSIIIGGFATEEEVQLATS